MSVRTWGGRVADIATIGMSLGKSAHRIPNVPYFFQNPESQCETTCASLTTMKSILWCISGFCKTFVIKRFDNNISGEITTTCHLPVQISYYFIRIRGANVVWMAYCHYFPCAALMCTISRYCLQSKIFLKAFCLCLVSDLGIFFFGFSKLICSSCSAMRSDTIIVIMIVTISFVPWCAYGPAATKVFPELVSAWIRTSLRRSCALIASSWNLCGLCFHLKWFFTFWPRSFRSPKDKLFHPDFRWLWVVLLEEFREIPCIFYKMICVVEVIKWISIPSFWLISTKLRPCILSLSHHVQQFGFFWWRDQVRRHSGFLWKWN